MDAHAVATLLDEFGKLSGRTQRPQTFMEIAGYPHYENVCSNFLAFFFDPEGPHGLRSLFLSALADSLSISGGKEGLGGDVSIGREITTAEGNRIDLLIKSDSHAVLIENKIYAAAANPFEDYAGYLDSLKNENEDAYEDQNKIKVLLTLYPSREGSDWGFRNLTHMDFASTVRSTLGHYVSEADTRYLTLMLDFLNTLENLGEGTRMNQEFVKLLADRSDEVEKFLIGVKQVREEARGKMQRLETLIDLKDNENVQQFFWQPNPNHRSRYFLQHRVHIDDESYVVIQPVISPSGWEIQSFYRVSPKAQNRSDLESSLREHGIPPENDFPIHPERFAYDHVNLEDIAAVVREELSRIAAVVRVLRNNISRSVG